MVGKFSGAGRESCPPPIPWRQVLERDLIGHLTVDASERGRYAQIPSIPVPLEFNALGVASYPQALSSGSRARVSSGR